MSRHKYRICPACNNARSYSYGTQTPTTCQCGNALRTCTRNEWIMNLQPAPQAAQTPEPDEVIIERASHIVARLRITALGIASAALLALTLGSASAAPTNNPTIAPAGCTITQAWEDGSRIATCPDGKVWHYDPDGLGPYCPKTSARFGSSGWHTARAARHAQHACTREIRH